ncbi:hypothetical protein ACIXFK_03760 [Bacteroides fragilis]
MYLDFIVDIAKIGNTAILKTETEMIEGTIVKLSKDLIAVKKTDGSVVVKKDSDIKNIEIQPEKLSAGVKDVDPDLPKQTTRCGMTLIKNDKVESFTCSICGKVKTSKKYAIEINNPNYKICNSCYGWTLARLEAK